MKTFEFQKLFIALFTLLAINLLSAQQYDDLYYNPKTDKEIFYPVATVEEEETEAVTEERYAEEQQDDDDASYSSRLHRFSPSSRYRRGFDYSFYNSPMLFDPYCTGSMGMMYNAYTYNPYSSYGYNDYFNSPWSYNSYYGGYGNGYAYNPYGYYDPYFSNYNYGYHNYNNNNNNNNNNNGVGVGNGSGGSSNGNGNGVGTHYGPRHTGNGLVVAPVRSNPYVVANSSVNTGRKNPRPTITNTNTGNEATPVRQNRVRVVRSQETNNDDDTPVRTTTQRETRSYNPPARSSSSETTTRNETRSYSPPARSSSNENTSRSSSSESSSRGSSSSSSNSSSSGPRKH
jgi:hypothetical protein